jgi:hypothetical protein
MQLQERFCSCFELYQATLGAYDDGAESPNHHHAERTSCPLLISSIFRLFDTLVPGAVRCFVATSSPIQSHQHPTIPVDAAHPRLDVLAGSHRGALAA